MMNIKNFAKKIYSSTGILIIGSLAAIIIPVVLFVFFQPYYDLYEKRIYHSGYDPKTILRKNIKSVKQAVNSSTENLARITIQARLSKKNTVKLSLTNEEGYVLRSIIKKKSNKNNITWEFLPIEDSAEKIYHLTIDIYNQSNNNDMVELDLIPTNKGMADIEIDDKTMDGKSLLFYTESKFASAKEKMFTFYKRIMTYKPTFIQWLFFPFLFLFLLLSVFSSWIAINEIRRKCDK